jgi:antitoxin component YwqK of YwqJK toxin-antitoxin module
MVFIRKLPMQLFEYRVGNTLSRFTVQFPGLKFQKLRPALPIQSRILQISVDGPACIEWYKNGQKKLEKWKINGILHRVDGPAYTVWHENGKKKLEEWCLNGKLHKLDGPAWIEWYENGNKKKQKYGIEMAIYNMF